MALRLGDTVPDFTAESTEGTIDFHDWIGDSWCILFSHPKDFTPVCTTELGRVAALKSEFGGPASMSGELSACGAKQLRGAGGQVTR